jgi:dTDP-4-dehydrorhamnose reductase
VRTFIERERPGAVLYVAYSQADRAITVDGAGTAARAAAAAGARFLFISTDLVFDGRTGNYDETMVAAPIMPYGRMKLEAEAAVKDAAPGAIVLRPSLLVGDSGIMLRPAFETAALIRGQPLTLYVDEWRSPIHVDDVARVAWELCVSDASGTFHVGGPERMSRFELGRLVCALYTFNVGLLREGTRPEDRPRDTSLNSRRVMTFLDWAPRSLAAMARPSLEPARA